MYPEHILKKSWKYQEEPHQKKPPLKGGFFY